jgi:20S proteasome alpha/beta subunit
VTLIVGIKCSDGIVLGADGAATLGTMGQNTIRQNVRKLTILSHKIIVGVSGPVGLGQRINGRMGDLYSEGKLTGTKPVDGMRIIREAIWPDIYGELQAASTAKNLIGPVATLSALCHTVIALPLDKKFALFQFDQQGAPEEATADLPFISIGSGQSTADPFLAFIRKIFWPDSLPNLETGIFSALWTLSHAIEINPGGVAEPIQIMVLERDSKDFKARELAEVDLQEHYEAINGAESALRDFRTLSRGSASPSVASVPPEPPSAT